MLLISYPQNAAREFGILPAIVLNDIKTLCDLHERNKTDYHDGRYWCFDSVESMREKFGKVSRHKVQDAIQVLIDNGLIVTGMYGKGLQRSKWYALTDVGYSYFTDSDRDPHLPPVGQCIDYQQDNALSTSRQMHLPPVDKCIDHQQVNTVYTNPYNLSYKQEYIPSLVQHNDTSIPATPQVEEGVYNLILKDNDFFRVTESQVKQYIQLYPDIDIDREMLSMTAWLEANQDKRKTKQDMPRFINGWLNRAYKNSTTTITNRKDSDSNGIQQHSRIHAQPEAFGAMGKIV